MTEATKRPISYREIRYRNVDGFEFLDANGARICGAEADYDPISLDEPSNDWAALIVRAVNAHDDMLAALKKIYARVNRDELDMTGLAYDECCIIARAAISKAESGA